MGTTTDIMINGDTINMEMDVNIKGELNVLGNLVAVEAEIMRHPWTLRQHEVGRCQSQASPQRCHSPALVCMVSIAAILTQDAAVLIRATTRTGAPTARRSGPASQFFGGIHGDLHTGRSLDDRHDPAGPDDLLLVGFAGHEAISQLFAFELDLLAENQTTIPFDQLLGQKMTVNLTLPESRATKRHFSGICAGSPRGAGQHLHLATVPRSCPSSGC